MRYIHKSGRITYRMLMCIIRDQMTEEQKDCDVTAADPLHDQYSYIGDSQFRVSNTGDCGGIGLSLIVPDQDGIDNLGLDDDHPVFIALEIGE